MFRRAFTVLLVLACTFAPVLPALEPMAPGAECSCCRGCCAAADCAMPPAQTRATTTTLVLVGAVEARTRIGRPALRATIVQPVSFSVKVFPSPLRTQFVQRVSEAVATVPLYRVQCTFLI